MRPRNLLTSFLFLLLLLPVAARAQAQQRDMGKEQKIWEQLQAVAPQSLDTFKRATEALDADNFDEAARLYGEVTKAAPGFTPAIRRTGLALAESGKRLQALPLLERAATLERSPENLISLAQVLGVSVPGGEVPNAEKERALKLAVEAQDLRGRHAPRALRALPPRAARQDQRRAVRRRHRLGTLRRPRSPHPRDEPTR